MTNETPLPGGQSTPGVVRIGETVRRPLSEGWEYRHALLRHLEALDFQYSPRVLGVDEQQREILTYLEGETMTGGEIPAREIGMMIRAFHDATEGSDLAASKEVVCHLDIAPWNTIHRDGKLVGMIDFDGATPGNRLEDVAYAGWTFLNIGLETEEHVRHGLRELCIGYELTDRSGLSDAIHRQQQRVLAWRTQLAATATDPRIRKMSQARTVLITQQLEWVAHHVNLIDEII